MPRFTSFDGTQISYTVQGSGAPLILVNGLVCDEWYWKYAVQHFTPHLQVITYDLRGHGNSAPPAVDEHVAIADHARDLQALSKHLNLHHPVVAGYSMGVQIMFEAYRQMGTLLGALVAVTGPYRNPAASFYGLPLPDRVIDGLFNLAYKLEKPMSYAWPRVFSSPLVYPISKLAGATRASRTDMQGFYDHARTMDVHLFLRFAQAAAHHCAEDVLSTVAVPTLIIGAKYDTFTPVSLSEHMAQTISGAEYLSIEEGTHTALIEEPEKINSALEDFLRRRVPQLFLPEPSAVV